MAKCIPKKICLCFFEENVGDLIELTKDEGVLIAQISNTNLVLPSDMENRLLPLIGKRIGILHTDNIPGKEYLIRVIPNSGQESDPTTAQDHCENEQISNCCEVM